MNDNDFNAKTIAVGGMLPQDMWGFLKDAYQQVKDLMQNDAVEIDDRDLRTTKADDANVSNKALSAEAGV